MHYVLLFVALVLGLGAVICWQTAAYIKENKQDTRKMRIRAWTTYLFGWVLFFTATILAGINQ